MEGVVRTRVGYAGGVERNPTYRNLGSHSETIQIDYDPEIVSYEKLLEVFWLDNAAYNSPVSRQYNSIIFYHDEEQKKLAIESYGNRKALKPGTVETEIIPYGGFNLAETYHQKYYLQSEGNLMRDALKSSEDFDHFIFSTAAARLNGYTGGYGDAALLEKEIDSYGLSDEGKELLRDIAARGLRAACPVPAK